MTDNKQHREIEVYQEFIVAEFSYIAQTAFQAHEDRARVSEFFLLSFGTFLAALFSFQFSNIELDLIYALFSIIFLVVSLLGALTILELSRLRLAWLESVRAMNNMKDFISQRCPMLGDCFVWKTNTIPKPYKIRSVGFLKALQVSILSSISFGAATAFIALLVGSEDVIWWASVILTCFSTMIFFGVFYYLPLKNS